AALEMRVAMEIDAGDTATGGEQWQSTADFITETTGGWRGSGRRMLRTGRELAGDREPTRRALRDGEISPEHAEVIVNAIKRLPPDEELRTEAEMVLLEHAGSLNASDLKIAGEHLWEVIDPEGYARDLEAKVKKQERSAQLDRFFKVVEDGLGGVRVRGRGTVEDGAVIKAALASLAAPAAADLEHSDPESGCSGKDPRDHGARIWDALVETCQTALDAKVLPSAHGRKPRVSVIIEYEKLVAGVGMATLDTGDRISAAAVRKLACDAEIIPVVMSRDGVILDVGRASRLVTPGIWDALVVRDRHCAFPGCRRPPIGCDAHHIVSWIDGGVTSLDGLVLLCRLHHRLIHTTAWEVRLNPVDKRPEFKPPPESRPLSGRLRGQVAPAGETTQSEWIRDRQPRG
ncbi:MAG: DUF222 domain-containing protein, partial [Actinomycetes bacterium]